MKQSEIDKAVNDWTDGFGGSTVEIAQLKKDVAAISFRAGAEMVNKAQPYSAEDMNEFLWWVRTQMFPVRDGWIWRYQNITDAKIIKADELIKIWGETK